MTVVMDAHSKWNHTSIRNVERASIHDFVAGCSEYLTGRVLDYGCGLQPYRHLVELAGGEYHGYDLIQFPSNVSEVDYKMPTGGFDAILCTQVLQFVPVYGGMSENWDDCADHREVPLMELLDFLRHCLADGRPGGPPYPERRRFAPPGHLILTYGTNWDEVEPADLCRWTKAGMEWLLGLAGFTVLRHERRAEVLLGGFRFPLGYGCLARA